MSDETKTFDETELSSSTLLILEAIVARLRGGEAFWTFEERLLPELTIAQQEGVIFFETAVAPGSYRAWLTPAAETQFLDPGWEAPMERTHGHYMRSLHEVHRLRSAAAVEAANVKGLLAYVTLPKKVRAELEAIQTRLRAAAAGKAAKAYAHVPSVARFEAMYAADGVPVLNRDMWEEEAQADG